MKRFFSLLLVLLIIAGTLVSASAAQSIQQMQKKYPSGTYWNHASTSANNPEGTTKTPCPDHTGVDTCNYVSALDYDLLGLTYRYQCFGFAIQLGREFYGSNPYEWKIDQNINNVKAGDIIRHYNHSFFITKVSGNRIEYVDCNGDPEQSDCVIQWGRVMTKEYLWQGLVFIQHAPYALTGTPVASRSLGQHTKSLFNYLIERFYVYRYIAWEYSMILFTAL